MPLLKSRIRFCRYLQQIKIPPAISKNPTTESTVLRVMTRVRLLPIPELPFSLIVSVLLDKDLVVVGREEVGLLENAVVKVVGETLGVDVSDSLEEVRFREEDDVEAIVKNMRVVVVVIGG